MKSTVGTARDGTSNERNLYDLMRIFHWKFHRLLTLYGVNKGALKRVKTGCFGKIFTSAPVSMSKLNGLELKLPLKIKFLIEDPRTVHQSPGS